MMTDPGNRLLAAVVAYVLLAIPLQIGCYFLIGEAAPLWASAILGFACGYNGGNLLSLWRRIWGNA